MANNGMNTFPSRSTLGVAVSAANTAASSGIATDSSGLSTQLKTTTPERFDVGELVFMDWKTGDLKNLSGVPASAALAAGPQLTQLNQTDFPTGIAGSGLSSANGIVLDDGSLFVVSGTTSANGSPQWTIVSAFKYSPKGVMLGRVMLSPLKGDATGAISQCCIALLSNGNIALSFTQYGGNKWFIVSQSLQIIASGNGSGNTSGFGIQHLQPLTNGGFITFGPGGIDTVSSDGVLVNTIPITGGYLAWQDDLNCNSVNLDVPQSAAVSGVGPRNWTPAKISNGGFGYIYWVSNSICYVQINADGTKRAEPVLLSTLSGTVSSYFKYAVASGGNICYAATGVNSAGVYGVVSEAGVIIKASSALANANPRSPVFVVSDASGGFAIVINSSLDSAAGSMYIKLMSSLGADVGGSPKLLGTSAYDRTIVLKLSTGTVVIWSNAQTAYTYQYAFVTPAGVVKSGVLANFGGGNSAQSGAALVKDDKVYGALTSGQSMGSGIPELAGFSISNTGVVVLQQYFLGITNAGASSGYINVRVALDYTGRYMYALYCNGTSTSITTIDLSTLYMMSLYLPGYTNLPGKPLILNTCRLRAFGQSLVAIDSDRTFPYGDVNTGTAYTMNMAVAMKPQPTVLLGVCLNTVERDGQLVYGTKGIFPVSSAWRLTSMVFDQSANVPPGNVGSINNGFINLKGF